MRRTAVLALLVLGLAVPMAGAQSESWAQKMFNQGSTHDFGTVPRGAKLSHRFTFTNIYAVPLTITATRAMCGCVSVEVSIETVKSKETAYIDVTMDARRFTGPKSVTVYVTYGPQYTSTATLQVSANSRPDVVFNPGEVNFGTVARGQTRTQVIDVEYAGTLDWRILDVVKNTAPVDVTLQEWYRRPGEVGYKVSVTLKPDAPAGALRQEFYLKTNDRASEMVPVLVEGRIQAPLSVMPNKVTFANVRVNEAAGGQKVVVSGNKPFRVVAIDGLSDGLEADLPASAGPVQIIMFKFKAPRPGAVSRQVTIRTRTDQDTEANVMVTVEATVVP